MQELWVLSLNDFPIGIYSTAEKADGAADIDRARCLKISSGVSLYYHKRSFAVDAVAGF